MTRFSGLVGYAFEDVETEPDVFETKHVEKRMSGQILRKSFNKFGASDQKFDDKVLENQISVLGSEYAYTNFTNMRYVKYLGQKWKITSVEVAKPRLILNVGGIYNEDS